MIKLDAHNTIGVFCAANAAHFLVFEFAHAKIYLHIKM